MEMNQAYRKTINCHYCIDLTVFLYIKLVFIPNKADRWYENVLLSNY